MKAHMPKALKPDCGEFASLTHLHIKGIAGIYRFWQNCRNRWCFQWEIMYFSVDFGKEKKKKRK